MKGVDRLRNNVGDGLQDPLQIPQVQVPELIGSMISVFLDSALIAAMLAANGTGVRRSWLDMALAPC